MNLVHLAESIWHWYCVSYSLRSVLSLDYGVLEEDRGKSDIEKKNEYARQMPEIQASAKRLEKLSKEHLETHEIFEGAATLFHIAIAVVAISVVAKRKEFWYVAMIGGAVGICVFGKALIQAPAALKEEPEVSSQPSSAEPHTAEKTSGTSENSGKSSHEPDH